MKRVIMAVIAVLALTGCSATGTREANEVIAATYVGKPADSFFLQYGPPHTEHRLNSGDTMYLWAENALVPSGIYGLQPVSASAPATTGRVIVQCELQIVASAAGSIRQIVVHSDTIGEWQLSRCRELFV